MGSSVVRAGYLGEGDPLAIRIGRADHLHTTALRHVRVHDVERECDHQRTPRVDNVEQEDAAVSLVQIADQLWDPVDLCRRRWDKRQGRVCRDVSVECACVVEGEYGWMRIACSQAPRLIRGHRGRDGRPGCRAGSRRAQGGLVEVERDRLVQGRSPGAVPSPVMERDLATALDRRRYRRGRICGRGCWCGCMRRRGCGCWSRSGRGCGRRCRGSRWSRSGCWCECRRWFGRRCRRRCRSWRRRGCWCLSGCERRCRGSRWGWRGRRCRGSR